MKEFWYTPQGISDPILNPEYPYELGVGFISSLTALRNLNRKTICGEYDECSIIDDEADIEDGNEADRRDFDWEVVFLEVEDRQVLILRELSADKMRNDYKMVRRDRNTYLNLQSGMEVVFIEFNLSIDPSITGCTRFHTAKHLSFCLI